MNGRIVLVAVLNALVALALAVLLTVLLTRGPDTAPGTDGAGAADGAAAGAATARERGPAAGEPAPEEVLPPSTPGAEVETAELKRDLMDREDLIPFEGRLGGTMDFYDPDGIRILSDRWVHARFDDGHVQGEMLLEYSVATDGAIRWRVLEARLQ